MLVVFGAITVDLVFPASHPSHAGETALSQVTQIGPGGKGGNQAVAAARDGAMVNLVGSVGKDSFGDVALGGLSHAGVGLRDVIRVDTGTGRASMCVKPDGQMTVTVTVDPGANRLTRASQVSDDLLGPATTLLLQMETEPRENADLIARAHQAGARIILNLSPPLPIDAEALRAVDVLIGDTRELAWAGRHLGTGPTPESLHAALGVPTVHMMGPGGAEAMSDDGFVHMPAMPAPLRDITAVGDCFIGVLAASLSRGLELPAAMRRASVAAALSASRSGAQSSMPTEPEVDAALLGAPQPTSRHTAHHEPAAVD